MSRNTPNRPLNEPQDLTDREKAPNEAAAAAEDDTPSSSEGTTAPLQIQPWIERVSISYLCILVMVACGIALCIYRGKENDMVKIGLVFTLFVSWFGWLWSEGKIRVEF